MVQDATSNDNTIAADTTSADAPAQLTEQQRAYLIKLETDIESDPNISPAEKSILMAEITGALAGNVTINFAVLRERILQQVEVEHEVTAEREAAVDGMMLDQLEDDYARTHLTARDHEIINIRSRAFDPNDDAAIHRIADTYSDPAKSYAALKANPAVVVAYSHLTQAQRTHGETHIQVLKHLLEELKDRPDLSAAEKDFLETVKNDHLVAKKAIEKELWRIEKGLDATRDELTAALKAGREEQETTHHHFGQTGPQDEAVEDMDDVTIVAQGGAKMNLGVAQVNAISKGESLFGRAPNEKEREGMIRKMVDHSTYAQKNLTPDEREQLVQRVAAKKAGGDITQDPAFKQAMLDGYEAILKDNNPARSIAVANEIQSMMEHRGFDKDKAQKMGDLLRAGAMGGTTPGGHLILANSDKNAVVEQTISNMETYAKTGQVTGLLAQISSYDTATKTAANVSKATGFSGMVEVLSTGTLTERAQGFMDGVSRRLELSSYLQQRIDHNKAALEKDTTLVKVFGDGHGHLDAAKFLDALVKNKAIHAKRANESDSEWSAEVVKELNLGGSDGLDEQELDIAGYEAGGGLKGVNKADLKKIHDRMVQLGITDVSVAMGLTDIKEMVERDQNDLQHGASPTPQAAAKAPRGVHHN